ncbi:MAG: type II toxin-antitoxin system RelE/ParE family toxin [Armatimonadetes bacterium]|nr:type II toxin-antitoxin system RelE/ParE family toxin [Armatimonadota bacterium]
MRIAQAIERRLETAPERYGAPLRGTLRGYRKLRAGDYRVVFRITADEVAVLAIRHRRDVYGAAERRS